MSFYFREKPRFGDKLRGKSGDELMQELKQQFEDNKPFFEPSTTRITRDPFERRTSFSRGFPFDDVEGFGRRGSDIRSHLDDLASRHPEFADHLLGSAWGDIPAFRNTNSLRNRRRRDSGGGSPSYQGHPDEDARSQTSGSSAASAASGASGVSSHGEPLNPSTNVFAEEQTDSSVKGDKDSRNTRRNPIPQYGLRNTVDIGQHRHEMDNNEKMHDNRGQRSMSAPPENRQQEAPILGRDKQSENEQNSQNPNQRFVSRVDITPQFVQPSCNEKSGAKPQQQSSNQQQKVPQQQSNVRHIPIFVEGRDEPVIPKNLEADETDSTGSWSYAKPQRTESPPHFQHSPQFSTPPQFQRPSHFNQHYRGGRARDWLPNFEEEFYSPQGTGFQHPGMRRHQQQQPFTSQSPPHQAAGQFRQPPQQEAKASQRRNQEGAYYNQPPPHSSAPQQKQPQQQQQQQEAAPEQPKKQKQPKDPLEKVAEVQKEVDSLNEQVIQWNGQSRKDKTYMYLDEMLTRELIKLDDIETEGKENVRQARKNAIKSIQDSISLLESKAPLNDQQPGAQEAMEIQKEDAPEAPVSVDNAESTKENNESIQDTRLKVDEQQEMPIPLPAAPSSPSHKEPASALPEVDNSSLPNAVAPAENIVVDETNSFEQPSNVEANVARAASTEIQTKPETEQQSSIIIETTAAETPEASVNAENTKSPKTTKRVRKTKKQQQPTPITDSAIPLPAPISHALDAAK